MSLFSVNIPTRANSSSRDSLLLRKTANIESMGAKVRLKGGNSLIDKIAGIKAMVESSLAEFKAKYYVIRNANELFNYIEKAAKDGIIAIDTETSGLDVFKDVIAGISLYSPSQVACYIPINHVSYITGVKVDNQIPVKDIKKAMKMIIDLNIKTLWHNYMFDRRVIKHQVGVVLPCYWDTYIASRLLNENEDEHGLKFLHNKYILNGKADIFKFGELFDGIPFPMLPIETGYPYAAHDAEMTYELFGFQLPYLTKGSPECIKQKLDRVCDVFYNIEIPVLTPTADMMDRGIELDLVRAYELKIKYDNIGKKYREEYLKCCEELEPEIKMYQCQVKHNNIEYPPNPASPQQLATMFYDVLKVLEPVWDRKEKKMTRPTGVEVLETIPEIPIAKAILNIRGISKLIGTYIDPLIENAKAGDGRIHGNYNTMGADCITGESLVITSNGYEKISDIVGNIEDNYFKSTDTIIVNKDCEYEVASNVVKFSSVDTVKITTRMGITIEGTPHHPIRVSGYTLDNRRTNRGINYNRKLYTTGEFKLLRDLTVGDLVEIPFGFKKFPTNYVKLSKSSYIPTTRSKVIPKNKPDIMTEELAELLGVYNADGSIRTSNGSYTIRISNDDPDVISRVKYLFNSVFGLNGKTSKANTTIETYVSSKGISWFDDYIEHGAKNKRVCKEVRMSPWSVIKAFIKGCTLDSSLSGNKLKLSITDDTTANFIQGSLLNYGILSAINRTDSKCHEYKYNRITISRFSYNTFITEVGVIEAKKERTMSTNKMNKPLQYGNYIYLPVTKIESSTNDVYDFTVPNTHSFIANSIICHNTGRFTCKKPNLSNIPSHNEEIRTMFKATDGMIFVGCDFSQQEMMAVASIADDHKMLKAFADKKDIYSAVASIAFGFKYEECVEKNKDGTTYKEGKDRRNKAKKVCLGIIYGKGIPAIAEELHVDIKKAQEIQDAVLRAYPELANYLENIVTSAKLNGYVETFFGRKRRLPDIQLPDFEFGENVSDEIKASYLTALSQARSYKEKDEIIKQARTKHINIRQNGGFIAQATRQAYNSPVQGTAADLTKMAMIAIYNRTISGDQRLKQLNAHMLLQIYDEIIMECPVENAQEVGKILEECMVSAGNDLKTQLICDAVYSYVWYGQEYTFDGSGKLIELKKED